MHATHEERDDEAQIRGLLHELARAVRARDVEAMIACCTTDVATFDLIPPLSHQGKDAVRAVWADTFAPFVGDLRFDISDLHVVVGGEVAYARCMTTFGGTTSDGVTVANRLRTTFVFVRVASDWWLAHEHVSAPFDLATGTALLHLNG